MTGSSGRPDLEVHGEQLLPLDEAAYALGNAMRADGSLADTSSLEAGGALGADGLASGTALLELTAAWGRQRQNLTAHCDRIAQHLRSTVREHTDFETVVATRFGRIGGMLDTSPPLSPSGPPQEAPYRSPLWRLVEEEGGEGQGGEPAR